MPGSLARTVGPWRSGTCSPTKTFCSPRITHCAVNSVMTARIDRVANSAGKPSSGSSSRRSGLAGARADALTPVRTRRTSATGNATTSAITS